MGWPRLLARPDRLTPQAVEAAAPSWVSLTDADIADRFDSLRHGGSPVNAVAGVREAVRRVTGRTFYPVQLLGGAAVARGEIAEMATGEGKTLTAAIPAALAALHHGGAHVMTPNAYLASRDYAELADVFTTLGLSSALLPEGSDATPEQKRAAYACDIVYGTGYEFGFDFLKDDVARRQFGALPLGLATQLRLAGRDVPHQPEPIQPVRPFALVDEADSVLLDEATTPLVLSGGGELSDDDRAIYRLARTVALSLIEGEDWRRNETGRGIELAESVRQLRPPAGLRLQRPWSQSIQQALHAEHVFVREVDYVLRPGKDGIEVQIVDEQTGRVFEDRSWRSGLHQAVQCREDVPLTPERLTIARMTRQRMLRQYDAIGGMTGTAQAAAAEFRSVYRCGVTPIARRLPNRRDDLATRYFEQFDAKLDAIVADAVARHAEGRPVLIGCRTIQAARTIHEAITAAGLDAVKLDGVQSEDEAAIVSRAGAAGAITVATNMAGRGTDIKPDAAALDAGGLHVIATERHRSSRVDGQLIGRAARQGQPGSSRFFVAADDDLVGARTSLARAIARRGGRGSGDLDARIARLQRQCETDDATTRAGMLRRDAWTEEVLESCAG